MFSLSVFVPTDLTAEAKSIIEKYFKKVCENYFWDEELAKDLLNYIERADLINEVFTQFNTFHQNYIIGFYSTFAESLTASRIQILTKTNYGNLVLNQLFSVLYSNYPTTKQYKSQTPFELTNDLKNKLKQLAMKIELYRNPVNLNDLRPYIGNMVENNEGLDIERAFRKAGDTWITEQGGYRFGIGHDGEHILGNRNGSRVKAISGLTGIVLTYYSQGDGTFAVVILLNDSKTVLVLKDLENLSLLIKSSPCSSKGLTKVNKGIPKFIDRTGKPISKIRIAAGETIGFTRSWIGIKNDKKVGMHFTIVKYQFIQQYREELGEGVNNPEKHPTWFIVPCSSESPVKCK